MSQAAVDQTTVEIDAEALRRRYREERDRRLRADGTAQYQMTAGPFAHFLDDPYVAPGFTRDPLERFPDLVQQATKALKLRMSGLINQGLEAL